MQAERLSTDYPSVAALLARRDALRYVAVASEARPRANGYTPESALSGTSPDPIQGIFDEMAVDRDTTIESNPIIAYEQRVRTRMVREMLNPALGDRVLCSMIAVRAIKSS